MALTCDTDRLVFTLLVEDAKELLAVGAALPVFGGMTVDNGFAATVD